MKIKVLGNNPTVIDCIAGDSLLDILTLNGIYISALCGGGGRCGKCKVQFVEGQCEPTPEDREFFSEDELARGLRLSCMAYPTKDCTISLLTDDEEDFEVLSDTMESGVDNGKTEDAVVKSTDEKESVSGSQETGLDKNGYFFGIDIGTTTLAISLVALSTGNVVDTYTSINHQRAYGADVISRIRAFDEGKGQEMTTCIRQDLQKGMLGLLLKNGIGGFLIKKIVIAGNTTMGHLLLGYDCHGLGQMPFTPVNIDTVTVSYRELFGGMAMDAPVIVMPGFSTFVGGDIVSGLLSCKLYEAEKPSLFVDLGTNGEMAVGNKEHILVTSTAAGPAFEGGNISCGIGSVSGAIYGVEINGEQVDIKTIGDKHPVGICGTGVIEVTAELLKEEILEDSGLLDEDYFDDGFVLVQTPDGDDIAFTQKDIRELQLAKAAVRGGLETLLLRYGITYEDLEHVYVAGGFGVHLNMEKAVAIGLLPREVKDKIVAVGNTSLAGAIAYGMNEEKESACKDMIGKAQEIDLSTDKEFQEFYMDAMFFE